jgi:leucyl aminopeptidase
MSDAPSFVPETEDAIPIYVLQANTLDAHLASLSTAQQTWVKGQHFKAGAGLSVQVPHENGDVAQVLVGAPGAAPRQTRFDLAKIAQMLPQATYKIVSGLEGEDLEEASLAWLLAAYKYRQPKGVPSAVSSLVAPVGIDVKRIETIARGEFLTRNLINTPANQLGPDGIEDAARKLADESGATVSSIVGSDLLENNFPLVHTVGRAADRSPRLIDLRFGDTGPKVTLVGKGVAFDTGGLNLKPGGSMALMKKDMGGAATVLGLAQMIMGLQLPVQLRVLIPAVENSVAGNAFRPGDILTARNGLTIEINNTDAEGRLILADALSYATEKPTDLLVSMATLTGAARVAVGADMAPFYTDDDALSQTLSAAARKVHDPVWRMPFHEPYEKMIEPLTADLDNAPSGGFAGSITAALFLRRFVGTARYVHFDIYGWQPSAAPGRPKGGVGQGARALLEALPALVG